jgi:hypothetical protein
MSKIHASNLMNRLVGQGNLFITKCDSPVSTFSLLKKAGSKTASDIICLQRVAGRCCTLWATMIACHVAGATVHAARQASKAPFPPRVRRLLFPCFSPYWLPKAHSWAAPVLVDEFDASGFQGATNREFVSGGK